MSLGLTLKEKREIADTIESRTGNKITGRQLQDDVEFLTYITSTLSNNSSISSISINGSSEASALPLESVTADIIRIVGSTASGFLINKLKWSKNKEIVVIIESTSGSVIVQNSNGYSLNNFTSSGASTNGRSSGLFFLYSGEEENSWFTDLSVNES